MCHGSWAGHVVVDFQCREACVLAISKDGLRYSPVSQCPTSFVCRLVFGGSALSICECLGSSQSLCLFVLKEGENTNLFVSPHAYLGSC